MVARTDGSSLETNVHPRSNCLLKIGRKFGQEEKSETKNHCKSVLTKPRGGTTLAANVRSFDVFGERNFDSNHSSKISIKFNQNGPTKKKKHNL